MAERDPWRDLHDLAQTGEQYARPLPPERVRALGNRRRARRRATLVAVTLAVIVIGGGAVITQTGLNTDQIPNPVVSQPQLVSPTPAPGPSTEPTRTPTRSLGSANLLIASDLPSRGGPALVQAPAGMGRVPDEVSVCIPDGLAVLGATGTATRDFRYPGEKVTAVQTVALQFADAAAARRAAQKVHGWVNECAATIGAKGHTLLDAVGKPVRVTVNTPAGTSGEFAVVPSYQQQAGDGGASGEGFFESLGVTRVDDRLMLTVEVVYGMDDNVSLLPGGDPSTDLPPHPQFGLVAAAVQRLSAP